MIGKAKKPRCFGNHWVPGKIGMLYYNNDTAWMKESIWSDALRHFNSYCYEKRPVVLLVDNCPAHKPIIGSKPWSSGHMKGFELSNVLVIFFEPNCTSHVQPLDAGMIQTAKALYRKRQITWVLRQIANTADGAEPQLNCNVRQAMEWFMQSLREVPTDTIKNCWIKTGILSPAQNAELSTGVRHNNRVASDERTGLSASIIDDLSALLMVMGKKVSTTYIPIAMASLVDLVDMHED